MEDGSSRGSWGYNHHYGNFRRMSVIRRNTCSYMLTEMLLLPNGEQNSHITILKMLSFHLDAFVSLLFYGNFYTNNE